MEIWDSVYIWERYSNLSENRLFLAGIWTWDLTGSKPPCKLLSNDNLIKLFRSYTFYSFYFCETRFKTETISSVDWELCWLHSNSLLWSRYLPVQLWNRTIQKSHHNCCRKTNHSWKGGSDVFHRIFFVESIFLFI